MYDMREENILFEQELNIERISSVLSHENKPHICDGPRMGLPQDSPNIGNVFVSS